MKRRQSKASKMNRIAREQSVVVDKIGFCTPIGNGTSSRLLWALEANTGVVWQDGKRPLSGRPAVESRLTGVDGASLWLLLIHNREKDKWMIETNERVFGRPVPNDRFITVVMNYCPRENHGAINQ